MGPSTLALQHSEKIEKTGGDISYSSHSRKRVIDKTPQKRISSSYSIIEKILSASRPRTRNDRDFAGETFDLSIIAHWTFRMLKEKNRTVKRNHRLYGGISVLLMEMRE
ncbi:hypothetical protein DICVIV_02304 [Dictyocaulus viviparus]|uniref:Uncharacterized protein n=1 Tax=Dictyocaulus viviparus TaxID=29172 RepID=A0A0D8Y5U1_DICVI|nr:hypothetical protein DICVIV_02304 [Dictyocaulus viviparus]